MPEEQPRRIDFTFRLEHLITLAGVAVTIIGGWYLIEFRVGTIEKNFEKHVERTERYMAQLTSAVNDIVRVDTRVQDHDRRLSNLERR